MKYQVTHKTCYEGHESVSIGHNQAWLEFRPVDHQQVESFHLKIDPEPSTHSRRIDSFGNPVHMFSFNEGYQRLSVIATTAVTVASRNVDRILPVTSWEDVVAALQVHLTDADRDALEFAFPTQRTPSSQEMREFAAISFTPRRSITDAVLDLTNRIHAEFTFDSRATTVNTPVAEVFRQRRGVCQDFAHLQIAMLRSLKISAKYISGYLRTHPPEGRARLVGADASHAWLSVYCGENVWIDVDPTNDTLCSSDHITLAWGRDYSDVPPLTGVFVGGGLHKLIVNVDVMPLE